MALGAPTEEARVWRRRLVWVAAALAGVLCLVLGLTSPNPPDLPSPWDRVSACVGWTYFVAWSLSFYPQLFVNYWRKSVDGLSLDYITLNLLGHTSYVIFNCSFRWSGSVKAEYARRHDGKPNVVQVNDVMFSLHAVLLTAALAGQVLLYRTQANTVSKPVMVAAAVAWAVAVVYGVIVTAGPDSMPAPFKPILFLYFLSYIKLAVTLTKYVPQVWVNYKRQSTVGWSVHNVVLDLSGGVLSLGQELMDSGISGDWGAIAGDPVKFGLGAVSIVYDVIFCLQHFVWYAGGHGHGRHVKGQRLVDDDEGVAATDAVTVAVG